jgi:hypothetical protein
VRAADCALAGTGSAAAMAKAPEIDWSTSSVEAGALSVKLNGELPRGWNGRFKAVARLLDQAGGRWASVRLTRAVVTVVGVRDGSEEDLRHFLESVVLQVNADLGLDGSSPGEAGEEISQAHRRGTADRAMAARFRAFADPAS